MSAPAIRYVASLPASSVFPGTRTPTSYLLPDTLEYEGWEKAGETLFVVGRAVMWWVGDWYLFGERKYGEQAAQAVGDRQAIRPGQSSRRPGSQGDSPPLAG